MTTPELQAAARVMYEYDPDIYDENGGPKNSEDLSHDHTEQKYQAFAAGLEAYLRGVSSQCSMRLLKHVFRNQANVSRETRDDRTDM